MDKMDLWLARLADAQRQAGTLADGRLSLPVRENGHITPAGRWLNRQRFEYRHGRLSEERLRLLTEGGFAMEALRGRHASPAVEPHELTPPGTEVATSLEDMVDAGRRFGVLYVDPPWRYDNQGTRAATHNHYGTMSQEDLLALPVEALAADDCFLHLWTTNGFLQDALNLMARWGFEFKSRLLWVKPSVGLGNYWRLRSESLLLGRRGQPRWKSHDLGDCVMAPRSEHSAKPEIVRQMIEQACDGPYLELFARRVSPGWTVWGNQIDDNDLFSRLYLQSSGQPDAPAVTRVSNAASGAFPGSVLPCDARSSE